jgi:hypothetical protein
MSADFCGSCYSRKVYCRSCKTTHCACSWSRLNCHVAFRRFLNAVVTGKHRWAGKYAQKTRTYGDYLYAQDREKFEVELKEERVEFHIWLRANPLLNKETQ